jgi:peptide/nickel transport system substrate-binding protein
VPRYVGSVLLAALTLAGCDKPVRPDRVVLAIESTPLTLDPRGAFNTDTAHVQQLLYDTLVTKGPDFDIVPELAVEWRSDATFTRLDFELRRGVRFHDGHLCGAADVAYTFNSLLDGGYGKAPAFHKLERVEVIDAMTVRFHSRVPNPGLLVDLVAVGIVPDGAGPELDRAPVGTGAFRLAAPYAGEGRLELAAFADHWRRAPAIGSLEVRVVSDAATRETALLAGEVDLAIGTAFAPEALRRMDGPLRVTSRPGGGIQYLAFNTEREAVSTPEFRRALTQALDRQAMVEALLGGRGRVAAGPLPPGHWAGDVLVPLPCDPAAARALARRCSLDLLTSHGLFERSVAAVVQEAWRPLGVEVRIVAVEPATFAHRLATGQFDVALHRFTGGNQFTTIFKGAFHSQSIHRDGQGEVNYARYSDPELDEAINAADSTADRTSQRSQYAAIQLRIAAAAPWVPLWHADVVVVANPRLVPIEVNAGGDFFGLRCH